MKTVQTAAIAAILTLSGVSVKAADVQYDTSKILILDGFVKSVDWGSPLKIIFHWNNGYDGVDWTVIGPAADDLFRMGWTRDMLKPNDRLDAVVHPDKAGSPTGSLMRFYLSDGRTMEIGPYGTTQVIPRDAFEMRFTNPNDDPMAGYYGNTQDFWASDPKGAWNANYNGRAWYNPDHTLVMFSEDLQPDHVTWKRSLNYGTWWLEEYGGHWTRCMIFNFSKIPFCHSPVNFQRIGDEWTAVLHAANATWVEHRELEKGRF